MIHSRVLLNFAADLSTSLPGMKGNVKPFRPRGGNSCCFLRRHMPNMQKFAGFFRPGLEDFTKCRETRKKQLTIRKSDARIRTKLNRLIEARYSSVPPGKVVQPPMGKGIIAEAGGSCPGFSCWAVREYLPDCHNSLWSAIIGCSDRPFRDFRISMNRLAKRFIFYTFLKG